MSNREFQQALINAARIMHPVDNDPLEVPCAHDLRDSLQVASDRLGINVMLTATRGRRDDDGEIDICLSRKDAIQVACAILVHAGNLPE